MTETEGNVVKAATELVRSINHEDAEMLQTYINCGATIGSYDVEELKRWEVFCIKLTDLAQAVQDNEG